MCNAYYIIITVELRQAFFEDFFILSTSTRCCTFFVFLSFTPHMRLVELLFFYQFYELSNSYFPNKFQFIVTIVTRDTLNQTHPKEVITTQLHRNQILPYLQSQSYEAFHRGYLYRNFKSPQKNT